MTALQDTINRLSMLGIRGATMTQDDAMEIEGEPVADPMETGDILLELALA